MQVVIAKKWNMQISVLPFSPCPLEPEYKRARQEIKKKSSDTLKLQKKAKKGKVI